MPPITSTLTPSAHGPTGAKPVNRGRQFVGTAIALVIFIVVILSMASPSMPSWQSKQNANRQHLAIPLPSSDVLEEDDDGGTTTTRINAKSRSNNATRHRKNASLNESASNKAATQAAAPQPPQPTSPPPKGGTPDASVQTVSIDDDSANAETGSSKLRIVDFRFRNESACAKKMSRGSLWDATKRKCFKSLSWNRKLANFEISDEELSCVWKEPWEESAFRPHEGAKPQQVVDTFFSRSQLANIPAALKSKYNKFMFHTSWLFRQYLPWLPLPEKQNKEKEEGKNQSASLSNEFRAAHDPELSFLYHLENFCITPFSGLRGYKPVGQPYDGHDEVRAQKGKDKFFATYFTHIRRRFLKADATISSLDFSIPNNANEIAPESFDERRVILVPISREIGWNRALTLHKVLSILGTVYNNPSEFFRPDSQSVKLDQRVPKSENEAPAPLLVFVLEPEADAAATKAKRSAVSSWGLFVRVLGFPWAVVSSSFAIDKDAATSITPGYLSYVAQNTNHALWLELQAVTNNSELGTTTPFNHHPDLAAFGNFAAKVAENSELCFRHGIAYQNCYHCEPSIPLEMERYSFGVYVQATPMRRMILDAFHDRLFMQCLPRASSTAQSDQLQIQRAEGPKGKQSGQLAPLPKVYFAVESDQVWLRSLNMFMQEIRESLVGDFRMRGFVSDILFRPAVLPKNSSIASHIDELRDVDIFVSMQTDARADIPFLKEGAVVIEITNPTTYAFPRRPGSEFDVFTNAMNQDYWFVETPPHSAAQPYSVPPQFLVDVIREAACRWMTMFARRHNEAAQMKKRDEELGGFSKLMLPPFVKQPQEEADKIREQLPILLPGRCRPMKYRTRKTVQIKMEFNEYAQSYVRSLLRSFIGVQTTNAVFRTSANASVAHFKPEAAQPTPSALLEIHNETAQTHEIAARLLELRGSSWRSSRFESRFPALWSVLLSHFLVGIGNARVKVHNRQRYHYPLARQFVCLNLSSSNIEENFVLVSQTQQPGVDENATTAAPGGSSSSADSTLTELFRGKFPQEVFEPLEEVGTTCLFVYFGPTPELPSAPPLPAKEGNLQRWKKRVFSEPHPRNFPPEPLVGPKLAGKINSFTQVGTGGVAGLMLKMTILTAFAMVACAAIVAVTIWGCLRVATILGLRKPKEAWKGPPPTAPVGHRA